ncbi:MAG: sensor histidine kinase, partial [Marmoricola sp.]|nr:sensor histidine kinase [Marmoricola sp.]
MQLLQDDGDRSFDALVRTAQRIDEALVLADADGTVVYANEAVGELLGYDVQELLGLRVNDFGRAEMQAFQGVAHQAVIDTGVEITVRDARVANAQGRQLAVDLTLTPY